MLGAICRTMRPAQWVKNVLVVAAPMAAGNIHSRVLWDTAIAFVAFCLISSAVYCLNDIIDADADRAHPRKRSRPIAAGELSIPVAVGIGALLFAVALGLALSTDTHLLWVVLLTYAAASTLYCVGFKHVPVIELALVSSGFLLRAVAGGAAADLSISRWFLIVASFGSLLLATGKRLSEMVTTPVAPTAGRRVLEQYTPSFLRMIISMSAGVTCTAYCLWAFEIGGTRSSPWPAISVAPFVVAVMRYAMDADAGRAEAPDVMVLGDRVLQALGLAWFICFSLSAFHA